MPFDFDTYLASKKASAKPETSFDFDSFLKSKEKTPPASVPLPPVQDATIPFDFDAYLKSKEPVASPIPSESQANVPFDFDSYMKSKETATPSLASQALQKQASEKAGLPAISDLTQEKPTSAGTALLRQFDVGTTAMASGMLGAARRAISPEGLQSAVQSPLLPTTLAETAIKYAGSAAKSLGVSPKYTDPLEFNRERAIANQEEALQKIPIIGTLVNKTRAFIGKENKIVNEILVNMPREKPVETQRLKDRINEINSQYRGTDKYGGEKHLGEITYATNVELRKQGPAKWILGSIAQSLMPMLSALATRNPAVGATLYAQQQMGQDYNQMADEQKESLTKAFDLSAVSGALSGILNYGGLDSIINSVGKTFLRRAAYSATWEGITEVADTLSNNLLAHFGWDKSRDILDGFAESLVAGVALGGAFGGLHKPKPVAPDMPATPSEAATPATATPATPGAATGTPATATANLHAEQNATLDKIRLLAADQGKQSVTDALNGVQAVTTEALGTRKGMGDVITSTMQRLFNKQVIFVSGANGRFNGASSRLFGDIILVSVDSVDPLHTVAWHEVWHEIDKDAPALATAARAAVLQTEQWKGYVADFNSKLDKGVKPIDLNSDKGASKFMADFLGQMGSDRKFFDQLTAKDPTLVQRLMEYLDVIIKAFKSKFSSKMMKGIGDLERARDAMSTAVAEYSRQRRPLQRAPVEQQRTAYDINAESQAALDRFKERVAKAQAETTPQMLGQAEGVQLAGEQVRKFNARYGKRQPQTGKPLASIVQPAAKPAPIKSLADLNIPIQEVPRDTQGTQGLPGAVGEGQEPGRAVPVNDAGQEAVIGRGNVQGNGRADEEVGQAKTGDVVAPAKTTAEIVKPSVATEQTIQIIDAPTWAQRIPKAELDAVMSEAEDIANAIRNDEYWFPPGIRVASDVVVQSGKTGNLPLRIALASLERRGETWTPNVGEGGTPLNQRRDVTPEPATPAESPYSRFEGKPEWDGIMKAREQAIARHPDVPLDEIDKAIGKSLDKYKPEMVGRKNISRFLFTGIENGIKDFYRKNNRLESLDTEGSPIENVTSRKDAGSLMERIQPFIDKLPEAEQATLDLFLADKQASKKYPSISDNAKNLQSAIEKIQDAYPDISFSRSVTPADDKAYLAAVEKGDTAYLAAVEKGDTATERRMVDEAAKKAGPHVDAFHGTKSPEPFSVFEPAYEANDRLFRQEGITDKGLLRANEADRETGPLYWFAADESDAATYAEGGKVMSVKLFGSVRSFDTRDAAVEAVRSGQADIGRFPDTTQAGHAGVDAFVVRDRNRIKSADPITRDSQGRVIPLSERFNPKVPDIRFSLPTKPMFYSGLARAIDGMTLKQAIPGDQMLNKVKGLQGVKAQDFVLHEGRGPTKGMPGMSVHAIPISDQLRDTVQGGQVLYSRPRAAPEKPGHIPTPQTTDPDFRALWLKMWDVMEDKRVIGRDEQMAYAAKWIKDNGGVERTFQEMAGGVLKLPNDWRRNSVEQTIFSDPTIKANWSTSNDATHTLMLTAMANSMAEGSEQGRTLQSRKMQSEMSDMRTPEGRRNLLYQLLLKATPKEMRALKAAGALDEVARVKQQVANVLKLADKLGLTKMSDDDLMDSAKFYKFLNDATQQRSDLLDKALEYWRNSILSGLQTPEVNLGGTALFDLIELFVQRPMESLLAGAINATPLSRIPGLKAAAQAAPSRASLAAMNASIIPAFGKALQVFRNVFATEHQLSGGNKMDVRGTSITGTKGRFIRLPQRLMLATDEFMKTLLQAGLVADYAHREAESLGIAPADLSQFIRDKTTDFTSDAWKKAIEESQRLTFTLRTGPASNLFNTLRLRYRGFYFLVPFVTAPANIMSTAFRKTPLGAIPALFKMATGKYGAHPDQAIRDMTEQVAAWLITGTLYSLTGSGDDDDTYITGSAVPNLKERDIKQSYFPPQSIRIGGQWVSYSRFEPFATMLTAMVDGIRAIKQAGKGHTEDAVQTLISSAKSSIRDKTFLQGLANVITAVDSADRSPDKVAKIVKEFIASWMPNVVRQPLRQADPYVRDNRAKAGNTFAGDMLRKILPAESLAAPPKYNLMGQPIAKGGTALSRILIPARTQPDKRMGRIEQTLVNYNNAQVDPEKRWWPDTTPIDSMKVHGDKVEMSEQQYEKYVKLRGEAAWRILRNRYPNTRNPTEHDIKMIQEAFTMAGNNARQKMRVVLK